MRHESIAIPLASNDLHGFFTAAVASEIKERTGLRLSLSSTDLVLRLTLFEPTSEHVDYRYATGEGGVVKNFVVPVGSRLQQQAEVVLINRSDGCVLFGPTLVSQTFIFDFESDFSDIDEHNFSLAELEMNELAREEAFPRLQQLLAQKVVDLLFYCW